MSNTSQGEGWWQASDLKWYPPHQVPDYSGGQPVQQQPQASAPSPEPGVAPQPEPQPTGVRENQWAAKAPWLVVIGGACLALLGLILPWGTQDVIGLDVNGIDTDDGKIMLVLALALGISAFIDLGRMATGSLVAVAILSMLMLLLVIIDMADITSTPFDYSIGIGLWINLVGAVAAIGGTIWRRVKTG